jgi:hypothetical protein
MSTATATAKATRAKAQIEARGSRILLVHDARVVDPETGALSGAASPTSYQIFGVIEGLTARSGDRVQAGDVKITISALDVPTRPRPAGWTVYVGGTDPAAFPTVGGTGVERLTIVDAPDVVQESGVSFIYELQGRR